LFNDHGCRDLLPALQIVLMYEIKTLIVIRLKTLKESII